MQHWKHSLISRFPIATNGLKATVYKGTAIYHKQNWVRQFTIPSKPWLASLMSTVSTPSSSFRSTKPRILLSVHSLFPQKTDFRACKAPENVLFYSISCSDNLFEQTINSRQADRQIKNSNNNNNINPVNAENAAIQAPKERKIPNSFFVFNFGGIKALKLGWDLFRSLRFLAPIRNALWASFCSFYGNLLLKLGCLPIIQYLLPNCSACVSVV